MRTLIQALKTKELRKKILFVLFIIIVYRIGSFIPTPGVDYNVVNKCMATIGSASQENFIGLVNLFSGGAMLQLSIFALGVMPYITASIVVQLLRVVIPRFEALHKEGQSGEAKLTQYTRYLTIGLAVLQSTTILVTARSGALFNYQCDQVIPDGSVFNLVVMVLIMTGGTGLGLSIVKHGAALHHAKIELQSALGEGDNLRNVLFFPYEADTGIQGDTVNPRRDFTFPSEFRKRFPYIEHCFLIQVIKSRVRSGVQVTHLIDDALIFPYDGQKLLFYIFHCVCLLESLLFCLS